MLARWAQEWAELATGMGNISNRWFEGWSFPTCKIRASVASRWQSKLARLFRMGWQELRVRVGQEWHKRSDLAKYRMGMRKAAIPLNAKPVAGTGFYFFTGSELSERAELLREHLPGEASGILREADEICARRFRLLGYENLDFTLDSGGGSSRDIDWHLDPVHGKRAPLDPWF